MNKVLTKWIRLYNVLWPFHLVSISSQTLQTKTIMNSHLVIKKTPQNLLVSIDCYFWLAEWCKQFIGTINLTLGTFQDVALAMASMRPCPLGPIMEKLSLSPEKYGAGRRFYIQTLDDHALSPDVQEKLVRENPPEGVFKIKGSDHCPFLSKPQSLHKILVEIAQIP